MAENQRLVTATMLTTPAALLLDRTTISRLLTVEDCITAVEACFAAHARGETLGPGLLHGEGINGEFHIKAGGIRVPGAFYACKVNGGFFRNRATNGLPNIQGLILLYDATTGQPLAVMESAEITIKRTGATTAVAARYLARNDARTVTIIGAGIQGAIQLASLTKVRPITRVHVWDVSAEKSAAFAAEQSAQLKVDVRPVTDLATATLASEIVVTCTPSHRWIVGHGMLSPGAFVAAVGADSPEKQEIEPELLATSSVVTDLTEQCQRVGDLHHAIAAGLMTAANVRGELGQVIIGRAPRRQNDREVIIFDATGTALQDVAAAGLVYQKALAAGGGVRFPFWG
jgi:alanine dehydrogenase